MTVLDKEIVDSIGYRDDEKYAYLIIYDHLEWDKELEEEHFQILQDKLNSYFVFIQTGQVQEQFPQKEIRKYVVLICFLYPPTKNAKDFLRAAQKTAKKLNTMIRYMVSSKEEREKLEREFNEA